MSRVTFSTVKNAAKSVGLCLEAVHVELLKHSKGLVTFVQLLDVALVERNAVAKTTKRCIFEMVTL